MKKLEPNEHLIIVTDEELLAIEQVLSPAEPPVVEFFEGIPSSTVASSSYTPDHYVSPTGTDTWANATSSSTPCSMATALANYAAGNIVECAEGVYTATNDVEDRGFIASTNASVGNTAIFYAKYPAVENYGSTALYSELRTSASPGTPLSIQGNYIIFDGFYFNQSAQGPPPSQGTIEITGTNCQLRRVAVDHIDETRGDENYNAVFISLANDVRITDCLFTGGDSSTGDSQNVTSITSYDTDNGIIENCTFDSNNVAIFLKGGPGDQTYTLRKNKIIRPQFRGLQMGLAYAGTAIYQNLVIGAGYLDFDMVNLADPGAQPLALNIYNNTFIIESNFVEVEGGIRMNTITDPTGYTYINNLHYVKTGYTGYFMWIASGIDTDLTAATQWDYNLYYDADSGQNWHYRGTTVSVFSGASSWVATSGVDTNGTYADPSFVAPASDNYHLSGGSAALTASSTGGPVGCYITGTEEIGVRSIPTY